MLSKVKSAVEHDDCFVVDDGSDKPFKVAKAGLSDAIQDRIRKMYCGGTVNMAQGGSVSDVSDEEVVNDENAIDESADIEPDVSGIEEARSDLTYSEASPDEPVAPINAGIYADTGSTDDSNDFESGVVYPKLEGVYGENLEAPEYAEIDQPEETAEDKQERIYETSMAISEGRDVILDEEGLIPRDQFEIELVRPKPKLSQPEETSSSAVWHKAPKPVVKAAAKAAAKPVSTVVKSSGPITSAAVAPIVSATEIATTPSAVATSPKPETVFGSEEAAKLITTTAISPFSSIKPGEIKTSSKAPEPKLASVAAPIAKAPVATQTLPLVPDEAPKTFADRLPAEFREYFDKSKNSVSFDLMRTMKDAGFDVSSPQTRALTESLSNQMALHKLSNEQQALAKAGIYEDLKRQADEEKEFLAKMTTAQEKYEAALVEAQKTMTAMQSKMQTQNDQVVHAETLLGNRTFLGRLGAFVGVILSGAGSFATGGRNLAIDALHKDLDERVDLQKRTELSKQSAAMQAYRAAGMTLKEAASMVKANALNLSAAKLRQSAAATKTTAAKQDLIGFATDIEASAQEEVTKALMAISARERISISDDFTKRSKENTARLAAVKTSAALAAASAKTGMPVAALVGNANALQQLAAAAVVTPAAITPAGTPATAAVTPAAGTPPAVTPAAVTPAAGKPAAVKSGTPAVVTAAVAKPVAPGAKAGAAEVTTSVAPMTAPTVSAQDVKAMEKPQAVVAPSAKTEQRLPDRVFVSPDTKATETKKSDSKAGAKQKKSDDSKSEAFTPEEKRNAAQIYAKYMSGGDGISPAEYEEMVRVEGATKAKSQAFINMFFSEKNPMAPGGLRYYPYISPAAARDFHVLHVHGKRTIDSIDEILEYLKKGRNASDRFFGFKSGELQSLITVLGDNIRFVEKLGVPNKSKYEHLAKLVGDISDISKSLVTTSAFNRGKLEQIKKYTKGIMSDAVYLYTRKTKEYDPTKQDDSSDSNEMGDAFGGR